ncbi:DUF4347 domain-containing protein, partial [Dapis sp. BLCC M229]|uniref:DUF4347 domain-containing protein n=1 Tax=Dapis sp. BLCC M229 TaxID=3400188 RepID=UPI003CE89A8D
MQTNSLLKAPATNSLASMNSMSFCQYSPTEVTNSIEASIANARELVIIDGGVDDYQQLLQGIKPGIYGMVLNPDRDGVEQITQILRNYRGIETLHILSHGSPGCLYLGNTQLSLETLDKYTEDLQQWFIEVPSPNLFIYGCQVAAGNTGTEFLAKVRGLTTANIAASANLTGNAALGGDWELEISLGEGKFIPAFTSEILATYSGVLDDSYIVDPVTMQDVLTQIYPAIPEFVRGLLGDQVNSVMGNATDAAQEIANNIQNATDVAQEIANNIQFKLTEKPNGSQHKLAISYTKPFVFDLTGLTPSIEIPVLGNLEPILDNAIELGLGDSVAQLPGSQAIFYQPTIEIYQKKLKQIGITLSGKLIRDESAFGKQITEEDLERIKDGLLYQFGIDEESIDKSSFDANTTTFSLELIYYIPEEQQIPNLASVFNGAMSDIKAHYNTSGETSSSGTSNTSGETSSSGTSNTSGETSSSGTANTSGGTSSSGT